MEEQHHSRNTIGVDVSGSGGSERALAIEAAENNVRRQYTKEEITALAERFKAAGYKTTSGNPKAGEKTMLSALEAAVGRSKRQIQRILTGESTSEKSEWEKATDAFRWAATRVEKAGGRQRSEEAAPCLHSSSCAVGVNSGLKSGHSAEQNQAS